MDWSMVDVSSARVLMRHRLHEVGHHAPVAAAVPGLRIVARRRRVTSLSHVVTRPGAEVVRLEPLHVAVEVAAGAHHARAAPGPRA